MCRKSATLALGAALLTVTLLVAQQPAMAEMTGKALPTAPKPYEVDVLTGDVSGGGTDANVWVQIHGSNGWSPVTELETLNRDDFERGRWDGYRVVSEDLGEVDRVCMQRNNAGLFPNWYLSMVKVYEWKEGVRKIHTAQFNGWMPSNTWICRPAR